MTPLARAVTTLIIDAESELHEPPRVSTVHHSEIRGATHIRTRGEEVCSIKCIEHLPAELHPGALRFQGKVLGDHDVPGLSPGPGQVVMDLQTSCQHPDARQNRSRLQLLRRNQEDDLVPQLLSDWNFA